MDASYFTDQLTTPYFSGGSTTNGTPGGDRWARVLGGKIGWLSELLHRVDADCSVTTNLKMQTHRKHEKKSAPPKTHHEIHSSPATATTSRRLATKYVTRVCPYSPPSIDPWFVEIGLVQLSQSVKTTIVTHTGRHRQTDGQTDRRTDRLIKYWHPVCTPV